MDDAYVAAVGVQDRLQLPDVGAWQQPKLIAVDAVVDDALHKLVAPVARPVAV